jgi:flagellar protein FliS
MYGHSPFSSHGQRSTLYSKIGLETDVQSASPHRLITMLFDGAFDAMNQASVAIQAGNIEMKTRALSRAVRIIDEGLGAGLNLEAGPLALDLRDLYAYTCQRLLQANLHQDLAAIDECRRVLTPLREAWNAIGSTSAALGGEVQRAA